MYSLKQARKFSRNINTADKNIALRFNQQKAAVFFVLLLVCSFATGVAYASVDDVADGETTASGTVSGSYTDTNSSNDTYESITERESGGKPSNRYSYLEHRWTIDVTGGDTVTFYVEAYHTSNNEGDNFIFAYSTDGSSYTDMLTVSKTSDNDTPQSYVLPTSTSGTVYIRVMDADQTSGNRTLDTIYIDDMYIRSESTPDPATNPAPANAAVDVAITADLSWTAGSGATSHDVYFGTSSPGTFQGNQAGTSFDPGTLANNTTYYWRIDEVNASGTITGTVWSFTTVVAAPAAATSPTPTNTAVDIAIKGNIGSLN